jgi:transposase
VAARDKLPADTYDLRHAQLQGRLIDLAVADWTNPHARRLAKRLFKYGDYLLTFVEFRDVPADNNPAEREVRPTVLMRKASYGNQSERGAHTRAVLMTIYRTLKRRGLDPLAVIVAALRTATATGQLPPLPAKIGSAG